MLPTRPEPYPVGAAVARIALSALLITGCAAIATLTVRSERVPGLRVVTTPLRVPLGDAQRVTLSVNTGAADLLLNAGASAQPGALLVGRAHHREDAPLNVKTTPGADALSATATLLPSHSPGRSFDGTINIGFRPGLAVRAALTPAADIALSTVTDLGDQDLNLARVRLTGLSASTQKGDLRVTLPADRSGTMRLRTGLGDLTVAAPAATANATSTLDARTVHGDLDASLDGRTRATLATTSGDLRLSARAATRGTITAQTSFGNVSVSIPAGLRVRVTARTRFGDLHLPDSFRRQGNVYVSPGGPADLTLVLDTHTGDVRVTTLEGAAQ